MSEKYTDQSEEAFKPLPQASADVSKESQLINHSSGDKSSGPSSTIERKGNSATAAASEVSTGTLFHCLCIWNGHAM